MADLDRSANEVMIVEVQFSNVAEQAKDAEARSRPASEVPMSNRKRALRELEFVGEPRSPHGRGVVTSKQKKVAALRIQHRPPTPNQTAQHNAIAGLVSAFESRSSRG